MESILQSIKKLLGIPENYDVFDTDIIIYINSAFSVLKQLGVGPSTGFRINDAVTTWSDYISSEDPNFETVKTYVYLKVKLVFDPPLSSSLLQSTKDMISELEWRLNSEAENKDKSVEVPIDEITDGGGKKY